MPCEYKKYLDKYEISGVCIPRMTKCEAWWRIIEKYKNGSMTGKKDDFDAFKDNACKGKGIKAARQDWYTYDVFKKIADRLKISPCEVPTTVGISQGDVRPIIWMREHSGKAGKTLTKPKKEQDKAIDYIVEMYNVNKKVTKRDIYNARQWALGKPLLTHHIWDTGKKIICPKCNKELTLYHKERSDGAAIFHYLESKDKG